MDLDTTEAINSLTRMMHNVNERNSLGQFTLNAVMVLLASARRQNHLNQVEVDLIETNFADVANELKSVPYEKVHKLFDNCQALWNAAAPR